jgi:retron-type reverse transcriptase
MPRQGGHFQATLYVIVFMKRSTKVGTPQGAVVSPLLSNVYLHYVFDLWVEAWRKKVAQGDVVVVRYADDRAPRAQRTEEGPMCVTA